MGTKKGATACGSCQRLDREGRTNKRWGQCTEQASPHYGRGRFVRHKACIFHVARACRSNCNLATDYGRLIDKVARLETALQKIGKLRPLAEFTNRTVFDMQVIARKALGYCLAPDHEGECTGCGGCCEKGE